MTRPCSAGLAAYLATRPRGGPVAECYSIIRAGKPTITVTSADVDVTVYPDGVTPGGVLGLAELGTLTLGAAESGGSPIVYKANSIRITGLKSKLGITATVDEQEISIDAVSPRAYLPAPSPGDGGTLGTGDLGTMTLGTTSSSVPSFDDSAETVDGLPFLLALQRGYLDGAFIQRDRAFLSDWGAPAIGTVTMTYGRLSTVTSIGRVRATVKVRSLLSLLDIDYPRNLYQASCLNTLYDAVCTLNPADFTVSGTVGTGPSAGVIPWSGSTDALWNLGTLAFTSGALDGFSVMVAFSTASELVLADPLPELPSAGDNFTVTRGCNHVRTDAGGCSGFSNTANYRGFDKVPPPSMAL